MSEKVSIYLVEDYFLLRTSYLNVLTKEKDFTAKGFESAEECMANLNVKAASDNVLPDVILMDLGLPGMNGIEATRIIKETYPKIKIIALTAHDNEEQVIACMASGADGYILKDAENHRLENKNRNNLDKIIRAVLLGALWYDPQISDISKSILPKPNSTDFDNLYDSDSIFSKRNAIKSILTNREYETLKLITEGRTNSEIAEVLTVSTNTAKAHVGNILLKLNVTDRVQAAVKAVRAGLF